MPELSWLRGYLSKEHLSEIQTAVDRVHVYGVFGEPGPLVEQESLAELTDTLELVTLDAVERDATSIESRQLCDQVFRLRRGLDLPRRPGLDELTEWLKTACYGVLADHGTMASRALRDVVILDAPADGDLTWGHRVQAGIASAWLLAIRKRGWEDLDRVERILRRLRAEQSEHEATYLEPGVAAHPAAWELVALYHLARTAEILAEYVSQGSSDRRYDPQQQTEAHIDRARYAAGKAGSVELENLIRLLLPTSRQLLANSLWSVARGLGTRMSLLVGELTSRDREQPYFEALPPQRQTLQARGIAGTSRRSVVVSLPTSAGKTLVAEFRILQALTQFEQEAGWVAYVAPTRALVNQVTARLRRDFRPLGLTVERLSPALEIDTFEAALLTEADAQDRFRVLVATPEKLDLLLRQGWEEQVGRPLTLVVVDEAHNLADPSRGIRLELLLATINREAANAQFLLLTPFIENAEEVASWLDPDSNESVQLELDWQPNDRVVFLSHREKGGRRGDYRLRFETLHTTRRTLAVPEPIKSGDDEGRRLGFTWSDVQSPNRLAASTAHALSERGCTVVLTQRPDYTWTVASELAESSSPLAESPPQLEAIERVVANEFGAGFPLLNLVRRGVGLHHAGLSDELKILMEWLVKSGYLRYLVATTTIAQGVNFPLSNVVFATHQYPYGLDMPPEDFWNIAGRAGRVDQGQTGAVGLVAPDDRRAATLRGFVDRAVTSLNSTLVGMVVDALERHGGTLQLHRLSADPMWSAFVQYLAHTYRQTSSHEAFASEIEQVLRGTMGFQRLRAAYPEAARQLVSAVQQYATQLEGSPLKLVDGTGFSLESVIGAIRRLDERRLGPDIWTSDLFAPRDESLPNMIGVLLDVPELRENLVEASRNATEPGDYLARVVRDWVHGASLEQLATDYFSRRPDGTELDRHQALTRCCQRLFGKIAPTVAWGLSALQTLTLRSEFDQLPAEEVARLRNLPSYVFYGVDTAPAVALRLLGVPRGAAGPLSSTYADTEDLGALRRSLRTSTAEEWTGSVGRIGADYFQVWRLLEETV